MILEKIFQTRVELKELALTGNIDIILLDSIRRRFKNKCYMSSYILDIIKIIQKSDSIISCTKQDASCVIDVQFRAKVLIFKEYDILHDCVVNKIDEKGNLVCNNEYASIYIKSNPALQNIKQKQVITVKAKLITYKTLTSEMSIKAIPFVPIIEKSMIFKVNVTKGTPLMDDKLHELEKKIEQLKDLNPEIIKYFHTLLYPYKSKDHFNKLKNMADVIQLDNINFKHGDIKYIYKDSSIPMDTPQILTIPPPNLDDPLESKEIQIHKDQLVVSESYDIVMSSIIHSYIEYFNDIFTFSSQYYNMNIISNNDVIWDIYRKYKR
jgi:hypothetical protein